MTAATETDTPTTARPTRPRRRRGLLIAAMCVALAVVATGCLDINSYNRMNDERIVRKMSILPRHKNLDQLAQVHAQRMADQCRIFHSSSATWIQPGYRSGAENVGVGKDVETVHQALMASPGHRANILGNHRTVGVGAVERPACGHNKVFVVQIFNG